MAVWGAPAATRTTPSARCARRSTSSRPSRRSATSSASRLAARVGVLTGEAAVTLGAEGQGMVAGDLVNTASRVQSAGRAGNRARRRRDPACDQRPSSTRRSARTSSRARQEPLQLWRASAWSRRPAARSSHRASRHRSSAATASSARSRTCSTRAPTRAGRVSSPSPASPASGSRASRGSSTSTSTASPRLTYWHRGRCLSYGDGVTYWALAEMVRMRAASPRDDDAAARSREAARRLEELVPDVDERAYLEPRLGAPARARRAPGRRSGGSLRCVAALLRAGRRRYATVLVFEDLQWADPGLLDFVEYLLDGRATRDCTSSRSLDPS